MGAKGESYEGGGAGRTQIWPWPLGGLQYLQEAPAPIHRKALTWAHVQRGQWLEPSELTVPTGHQQGTKSSRERRGAPSQAWDVRAFRWRCLGLRTILPRLGGPTWNYFPSDSYGRDPSNLWNDTSYLTTPCKHGFSSLPQSSIETLQEYCYSFSISFCFDWIKPQRIFKV